MIDQLPPAARWEWLKKQPDAIKLVDFIDLHEGQKEIVENATRYNVVACGRRFGKTVLGSDVIVRKPLEGYPAAWFAPTYKMMLEVWRELVKVTKPIATKQNASEFRIELNTGGVIEMWSLDNPDAARGRKYAEIVIDEAAMIRHLETAWIDVLLPTLIDYSGSAWFLSTPRGTNFYHKMFQWGLDESRKQWSAWQKPTWANPHINDGEIEMMRQQMTPRSFQQEIEAKFLEDVEGALWSQSVIDENRVVNHPPLAKIVTAIDPASWSGETGIITAGVTIKHSQPHVYILSDDTSTADPDTWAKAAITASNKGQSDYVVYERNQGGKMVARTLHVIDPKAVVKDVLATRGKMTRAEPISVLYAQGRVHHVGYFEKLEEQMTTFVTGEKSPDRLDALVWCIFELLGLGEKKKGQTRVHKIKPSQRFQPKVYGTRRR